MTEVKGTYTVEPSPSAPKFKKLSRLESEIQADKLNGEQLWFPRWDCFCCADTGFIKDLLIKFVIPDYNPWTDKIPVCSNCSVIHKKNFFDPANSIQSSLDTRIDRATCQQLHEYNLSVWKRWQKIDYQKTLKQQEKIAKFTQNFGGASD